MFVCYLLINISFEWKPKPSRFISRTHFSWNYQIIANLLIYIINRSTFILFSKTLFINQKKKQTIFAFRHDVLWSFVGDNLKSSFLPRLIFIWRTFSRRVTARWWRQWDKNQVLNQKVEISGVTLSEVLYVIHKINSC